MKSGDTIPIPVRSLVFYLPFSVSKCDHQVYVCLIIVIAEEGFLPTISMLGYVVGKTRSHYSRNSCHKVESYLYRYYVKKWVWCPWICRRQLASVRQPKAASTSRLLGASRSKYLLPAIMLLAPVVKNNYLLKLIYGAK
jgi:hypothetical protein